MFLNLQVTVSLNIGSSGLGEMSWLNEICEQFKRLTYEKLRGIWNQSEEEDPSAHIHNLISASGERRVEGSRLRCPLTSVKSHQAHGDAQSKDLNFESCTSRNDCTLIPEHHWPGADQGGQDLGKISVGYPECLANDTLYCGCPAGEGATEICVACNGYQFLSTMLHFCVY